MKKNEVELYETARRAEVGASTGLPMEQGATELAGIMFSDPYDYIVIAEDGESARLKTKDELTIEQRRAVKEITI